MTKEKLDGSNNKEIQSKDPWELIASHFKNPDFNLRSTPYPKLHEEFKHSIDLGFDQVKNKGIVKVHKA